MAGSEFDGILDRKVEGKKSENITERQKRSDTDGMLLVWGVS